MIVPCAIRSAERCRSHRRDRDQSAKTIAGKIPVGARGEAANIRARDRAKKGPLGRETVQPPAAGRCDADLGGVTAEGDASGIALHGEFVRERGHGKADRRPSPVQTEKRGCGTRRAFPLHGEADQAVAADREVADRVPVQRAVEFDLFQDLSRQGQ